MKRYRLFLFLLPLAMPPAHSYPEIAPGLLYKHVVMRKPKQSIHLLIADPKQIDIRIGIAEEKCASAQTTSAIAETNHAIAAINAGFFDFGCKNKVQDAILKILDCLGYSNYNAFPIYTLRRNGDYYSLSHPFTGAICWKNADQCPTFSIIRAKAILRINDVEHEVSELNKPCPTEPTLYSPTYDSQTPFFHEPVDIIVIEDARISKIYRASHGRKKIPQRGWVYVLPRSHREQVNHVHIGDSASVQISNHLTPEHISSPEDEAIWSEADNILASTPLLIHNGSIVEQLKEYSSEFYTKQHPRSAVGILKNGNWLFVVVDGRQKESEGLTILQLARFMKKMGCTAALNLDGGGSTTMVLKNKIVNAPSGREYSLFRNERAISNALLLFPKSMDDSLSR